MSITVRENHRLSGRVNIGVLDAQLKQVYDRYVDAADWDADPQAVAATIADYLAKVPTPPVLGSAVNKSAVTLTDPQITAKLAALEAARLAAIEAAKPPAVTGAK